MKKKNNIVIKLSKVSKKYIVHHEKPTLVEKIANGRDEEFWALKDINLEVRKGEKLGIIGPNGSGKTTLLKIISGIAYPTEGKIQTYGKIISLIDLEAGFHPDLTGIQNVYLNGMIIGMDRDEVAKKLSDIIEFAGIGRFIDASLFTYSSGMQLRLGFSVAVHADPDILVMDENLAVGDIDFQEKSYQKIQELSKRGKTIILVSHNLKLINSFCKKTIWLNYGKVQLFDKNKKVINSYIKSLV